MFSAVKIFVQLFSPLSDLCTYSFPFNLLHIYTSINIRAYALISKFLSIKADDFFDAHFNSGAKLKTRI